MTAQRPFSKSFVMNTTVTHMQRAIGISVNKSFARFKEFEGDSIKGTEIMETMSALSSLNKLIEEFKTNNPALFS